MRMWHRARLRSIHQLRNFTTAARRQIEDEGDWFYSSEWWGDHSDGHTLLRSNSHKGNGVVSVVAYHSSRPGEIHWPGMEKWLQQRYAEIHPGSDYNEKFRLLGYQWRVLRFNDETRQSTAKIMAAYQESDPGSVFIMQQANCIAVPYLKSMLSVGLASIASCNYNLMDAIHGKKTMNILCIGHGGGSLPLFLASKIKGAVVHVVEIDPLVISASTQAMGFPHFSVMSPSGKRLLSKPDPISEVLWKGVHERLSLFQADAEDFIQNATNLYDLVFVDAYNGEDIFPYKLRDPDSPFLKALKDRLNAEHGTVVVNLHSDSDILDNVDSVPSLHSIPPMGRYVSGVCRAYQEVLAGDGRCVLGFSVSAPWVCNTSLVVCRGFRTDDDGSLQRGKVLNSLISKSLEVGKVMNFPFSCLEYIKRGFILAD